MPALRPCNPEANDRVSSGKLKLIPLLPDMIT